jgi:predicted RNA-binding protein with PUA-like domain
LSDHDGCMQYWLVKQEPEDYSWATFEKEGKAAWTGVRSFPARKNLRSMHKGDLVLFYHSGTGKEVVGIARVLKEAYQDPTDKEGEWVAVDLEPIKGLGRPVTLTQIRADSALKEILLVRQSRLSVMPLTSGQFERILTLGETKVR